nr:hypothetical protein [Deltaproteobacteria bacterium]
EWPRPFVYRVANRHLRKHADKCRRTATSPDMTMLPDDLELGSTARRDDVEYMARLNIDQRIMLRAMRRLGGRSSADFMITDDQRILYLRFWVGMTQQEIADVFEVPRGTLLGRLRKAIADVRAQMEEIEQEEPGSTKTSATLLDRWWARLEAAEQ